MVIKANLAPLQGQPLGLMNFDFAVGRKVQTFYVPDPDKSVYAGLDVQTTITVEVDAITSRGNLTDGLTTKLETLTFTGNLVFVWHVPDYTLFGVLT